MGPNFLNQISTLTEGLFKWTLERTRGFAISAPYDSAEISDVQQLQTSVAILIYPYFCIMFLL